MSKSRVTLAVLLGAALLAAGVALRGCSTSDPSGGSADAPADEAATAGDRPRRTHVVPRRATPETAPREKAPPGTAPGTGLLRVEAIPAAGRKLRWAQISFSDGVRNFVSRPGGALELQIPVGATGEVAVRVAGGHLPWRTTVESMPAEGLTLRALLEPALRVAGVVVSQDGETPAPNCHVKVVFATPNVGRAAWTRKDGSFLLEGFEAGPVRLEVLGREALGGNLVAEVEAPDEHVRIVLPRLVRVRFRLLDEGTGRGLETPSATLVELRAEDETTLQHDAVTEGNSTRPRARWQQRLEGAAPRRYRVLADGYAATGVLEVDPSIGETNRVIEVRLRADASTAGTLVLLPVAEDGPAPERILVTRVASARAERVVEVVDGRAEVSLPVGPNKLLIGSGRGADTAHPWLQEKLEVDLGAGERRAVSVTLRRGGFLRMPVDEGGVSPDRVLRGTTRLSNRFRKLGGGDPHWLCGPLPAGEYRVRASNGRLTATVAVGPGEVSSVEYADR